MNKPSYKNIDENYARTLVETGKLDEAARYYDSFDYTGATDLQRAKVLARINEYQRNAAHNQAVYKSIGEENTAKLKFNDSWKNPNSYNELRYAKDATGNFIYQDDESFARENPQLAQFHEYYARLGSSYEINEEDFGYGTIYSIGKSNNDAVTLKATLPYKKKSSIPFFGRDWLMKDNNFDVDAVFNKLNSYGVTREMLKASGVSITQKDNGDTEFIYDKYSDYGPMLTVALAEASEKYNNVENRVKFQGYDKEGNIINYNSPMYSSGNYIRNHDALDASALGVMLNNVSDSESLSKKIDAGDFDNEIVTSGTVFALPSIEKEADKKKIVDFTKAMVFGRYDHYVTFDADDPEPMHKIEKDKEFGEFMLAMSVRDLNQIHIHGMTLNGKTGILIALDPNKINDKGEARGKRMQMFIPGYLNTLTGDAINNSTDLQAMMVYNDMKQYGDNYRHRFKDGTSAIINNGIARKFDANGDLILDEEYTNDDLLRDLDRDFILRQANMQITQYMRADGTFNIDSVEKVAKAIAYNAAEELYPGLELQDTDGNLITIEDIFSSNKTNIQKSYNNSNSYVRAKLDEILNLYNTIVGYAYNN